MVFRHSGNSGDVIYALPTVIALRNETVPVQLCLNLNRKGCHRDHPAGAMMLSGKMAEMLTPLLAHQSYIDKVTIYSNQPVDFDLDLVRELPVTLTSGDISRWYFHVFNAYYDLSKAWIQATPCADYSDSIVLARSARYLNPHIDYGFLKNYGSVVFVGVESEYQLMKKIIPTLVWAPVHDFLEMAGIIAGAKLFIGNQSFPYSLAEAMKVPRLLELCYFSPNVVIHGANGYDFYFQKHLEEQVRRLVFEE